MEDKEKIKNLLFEKIEDYIKQINNIVLLSEYVINLVQKYLPNCSPIILNKFRHYASCMFKVKECKTIITKELNYYTLKVK